TARGFPRRTAAVRSDRPHGPRGAAPRYRPVTSMIGARRADAPASTKASPEVGLAMNIVVLVKQVPDSGGTRSLDPGDNTVARAGADNVINEMDEYAIEEALQL